MVAIPITSLLTLLLISLFGGIVAGASSRDLERGLFQFFGGTTLGLMIMIIVYARG